MSGPDFDAKERVKQATDIVDLVGSYLQLRRQGAQFVAHCPWHDDRRPSLQINPARQTWVCWVCDIRGDIFDFVMRREGVEFYDALRMLADRAGIQLKPRKNMPKRGSVDDKNTLYRAMAWAAELFHQVLLHANDSAAARDYLAERKLVSESIDRFRLGFSPLNPSWLVAQAEATEFSPDVLEACGLIMRPERSNAWKDRFRGRLLFPIHDPLGRVVAFGGRLVPGVFPENEEPPGKYINSPETRLFSKSDNLYALHLAKDSTTRSRHLVVMEGYTDVIAAYQAGMRGIVAALGTAVNQRHVKLMKRYADRITLVLDGDTAGQRRTNEVLDLFVAENVDLRILSLESGLDPCDFVLQRGAADLQQLIDVAPDALEHRIRTETNGIDLVNDTHGAGQALDRILQTIAQVPMSLTATSASTRLRQDQMLSRLARMFRVEKERLRDRLNDLRATAARTNNSAEASERPRLGLDGANPAEVELLGLLLLDHSLLDIAVESVSPEDFHNGPLKEIYLRLCEGFHEGQDVSFEGLMVHFEDIQLRGLLTLLDEEANSKQSATVLDCRQRLDSVISVFRQRAEQHGDSQLLGQLEEAALGLTEEAKTLEEMLRKARHRHGISAPTDGSTP